MTTQPATPFQGYSSPAFTPVPDLFFDEQVQDLGEAELKVLLYIFRRTYGFKKAADAISYSQFLTGITTRDGRQLDKGAGVSRASLYKALHKLVERGYIFRHKNQEEEGDLTTTVYELNIDGFPHFGDNPPQGQSKSKTAPSKKRGGSSNSEPGVVQILNQGGSSNFEPTINSINQKTVIKKQSSVGQPPAVDNLTDADLADPELTDQQLTDNYTDFELEMLSELLQHQGIQPTDCPRLAQTLLDNDRDGQFIRAWAAWIAAHPDIARPEAYLRRMIERNEPPPRERPGLNHQPTSPPAAAPPGHQPPQTRNNAGIDFSKYQPGGKYGFLTRKEAAG